MDEWKEIPGFKNYLASKDGRIKSIARHGTKGGLMKSHIDRGGYERLHLRKGGRNKFMRVHQLIALAFIPNPDGKKYVNHIDGDKTNNHVDNLEWCTFKENMKHAHSSGLFSKNVGQNSPQTHLTNNDVLQMRNTYNLGCFTQKEIAKAWNVSRSTARDIVTHNRWTHI